MSVFVPAVLINRHEINHLVAHWGYWLVLALVFLQSSGVPVPGTSALAAAAIYAGTTHHLAISGVIAAACVGAIAGYALAFAVGRSGGWTLLNRYGHRVRLTETRLEVGRRFFLAHGGKVVFVGRFITGLRTWGGFIAGANRMRWPKFLVLNVAGGVAWAVLNGLGYFFFGHLLTSASTPVNIALVVLGLGWLAVSFTYLRRLTVDPRGRRSST